ncbi:MAG: methyltransferase [bacterium]
MENLTSEQFDSIDLRIWQPAKGHRYGPESLALADFVQLKAGERVIELGSGVGVISLMLAARAKGVSITAVEIQELLHAIAVRNVRENGYELSVTCVNDDYRRFAEANRNAFDLVVSNPPFYVAGQGRMSPDPQRAQARHEMNGTLADLVASADEMLAPNGRLKIVLDSRRLDELMDTAERKKFKACRSDISNQHAFVLVEFKKA